MKTNEKNKTHTHTTKLLNFSQKCKNKLENIKIKAYNNNNNIIYNVLI